MFQAPRFLRAGMELTSAWLNGLVVLLMRAQVMLGSDSGLEMNQTDKGTFLRIAFQNNQATLAYTTSGGITARSGTTAGFGSVFLVDVSVASDGTTCTLTTTAVTYTVFNLSATTGGIAGGKYCWIEQDVTGNWFVTAAEC